MIKIVVQIQANVKSLDLIPREAEVFSSALEIAVHPLGDSRPWSEAHADNEAVIFSSILKIAVHLVVVRLSLLLASRPARCMLTARLRSSPPR